MIDTIDNLNNTTIASSVHIASVVSISRRGLFYGRGGESIAVAGAYGNSRLR